MLTMPQKYIDASEVQLRKKSSCLDFLNRHFFCLTTLQCHFSV